MSDDQNATDTTGNEQSSEAQGAEDTKKQASLTAGDKDSSKDEGATEQEAQETKDDATDEKSEQSEDQQQGKEKTESDLAEFKLDVPEGHETFAKDFESFESDVKDWLKDNPEANATDALGWAAKRQSERMMSQIQEASQAFETKLDEWSDKSRNDKEFGGEKFEENIAIARKALDNLESPELEKILDDSGLSLHPDVIRVFYQLGVAQKDAKTHSPGSPDRGRESDENAIYPG